jgi:hypothetical protein
MLGLNEAETDYSPKKKPGWAAGLFWHADDTTLKAVSSL